MGKTISLGRVCKFTFHYAKLRLLLIQVSSMRPLCGLANSFRKLSPFLDIEFLLFLGFPKLLSSGPHWQGTHRDEDTR
jgi:hypothetical protein